MRSYVRAAILTLCAILAAYGIKTAGVNALGLDPESVALDEYGDMMLFARTLFQNESDAFQTLTMELCELDGLSIRRRADGSSCVRVDGDYVPTAEALSRLGAEDPEGLAALADRLFAGSEVEVENSDGDTLVEGYASVLNLSVSGGEVLFTTQYHELGCVGVAYTAGAPLPGYNTIALVEDWVIFYQMDKT